MKGGHIRQIEASEIRAQGYTLIGDGVYDFRRFIQRHPGGKDIAFLLGRDATFTLLNSHGVRGEWPSFIDGFKIGALKGPFREPLEAEFYSLFQRLKSKGKFTPKRSEIYFFYLRLLLCYVLGAALAMISPIYGAIFLILGHIDVIWWIHDIAHQSIYESSQKSKRATTFFSILFLGTPSLEFHYIAHRLHHAWTNIFGLDGALNTGPIIWHPKMVSRSHPRLIPWQIYIWYLLVLPLIFPLFLISSTVMALKRGRYLACLALILRWVGWIYLLQGDLILLLLPPTIGGYWLALLSSLNHFHLPMRDAPELGYVRAVAERVQNFNRRSPWVTWLMGGLNYHIEHHLFATMPRHRYGEIADEIRALFERHHLTYQSWGFIDGLFALSQRLRNPLELPEGMK